jgi:hypothetical protein
MNRLAWLLRPDGDHVLDVGEELEKLAKGENPTIDEVIRRYAPKQYDQGPSGPVLKDIPGEYVLNVLNGICGNRKTLTTATLSQAMMMGEDYGERLRRASESHLNFDKFVEHILPEVKQEYPRESEEDLYYLARTEARRRVASIDARFSKAGK